METFPPFLMGRCKMTLKLANKFLFAILQILWINQAPALVLEELNSRE